MDVTSFLKGEVFRAVVVTLIPGILATIPLAFYVHIAFPGLECMLAGKDAVTGTLLVAASIATGFIIEDVGSRIETNFERIYLWKNTALITKQQFDEDWYGYLWKTPDKTAIGYSYTADVALRMKFENSCAVALVICLISLIAFHAHGFIQASITLPVIVMSVLIAYLIRESYTGVEVLSRLRRELSEERTT